MSANTKISLLTTLLASASLAGVVNAAPITYTGSAQIVAPLLTSNGLLADFLGTIPAVNDILNFTITYDPATLGAQVPAGTDGASYTGGVTAASMTLNGVTLQTNSTGPGQASVLVTTSQTPGQFGIQGFFDGYGLTAGNLANANGRRWAVNFFFYDYLGSAGQLPNLSAPQSIPNFSDFQFVGLGFRSFNAAGQFDGFGALVLALRPAVINNVPEPATLGLLTFGLLGASLRRRIERASCHLRSG